MTSSKVIRAKLKHISAPRSSKLWQTSTQNFCCFRGVRLHSRYSEQRSMSYSLTSQRNRHSKFESICDREGMVNQGEAAREFAVMQEGLKHNTTESLRETSACSTPSSGHAGWPFVWISSPGGPVLGTFLERSGLFPPPPAPYLGAGRPHRCVHVQLRDFV